MEAQIVKIVFYHQLALRSVFKHSLLDFSCFWKPAGDDMFWVNPCKPLAGRIKSMFARD